MVSSDVYFYVVIFISLFLTATYPRIVSSFRNYEQFCCEHSHPFASCNCARFLQFMHNSEITGWWICSSPTFPHVAKVPAQMVVTIDTPNSNVCFPASSPINTSLIFACLIPVTGHHPFYFSYLLCLGLGTR